VPKLSVTLPSTLSAKQWLATRLTQMLAAYERSQRARADRVIQRFSYLGARIPGDQQKPAEVETCDLVVPYRPLMVRVAQ